MLAAAAYLKGMREKAGMSRAKLAAVLDVSEMTVWRIEEEGQEPRAALLAAFVRAVQARWEDIDALLSNANATVEDGSRLAAEAATMTDEELDAAIELFEDLKANPPALHRWFGYGQRLLDERGD